MHTALGVNLAQGVWEPTEPGRDWSVFTDSPCQEEEYLHLRVNPKWVWHFSPRTSKQRQLTGANLEEERAGDLRTKLKLLFNLTTNTLGMMTHTPANAGGPRPPVTPAPRSLSWNQGRGRGVSPEPGSPEGPPGERYPPRGPWEGNQDPLIPTAHWFGGGCGPGCSG